MLKGKKKSRKEMPEQPRAKDFFDCILPGNIKFFANYCIVGDTYRCVWVIREYPPTTEEQAILAQLADRTGITLHLYHRRVTPMEERQIVNNAARKNRLMAGDHDITQAMEAEGNLQDVQTLLATMRNNREILLHCSVFVELKAKSFAALEQLQSEIAMELTRAKISVDKLTLRQQEGFLSVLPVGRNQFGDQYERVLPAGSVANMYPLSFSGKTDPQGFYIGRDKYGTNILVDLDRRSNDKTNGSALILGNSGQGKSYLMKLLLTNFREAGKAVILLDVEAEYEDLTQNLGGCYVDYLSGNYIINPLEPKLWADDPQEQEEGPETFRKATRLSQHIAFLKDFFRSYKDFTDAQLDTLEILLEKLYASRGITDSTDFSVLKPVQYPVMAEFYWLCQKEYAEFDDTQKHLYTQEMLREVCLGIHSMCVGSESRFFNGHTNIADDQFLCFGVKGLMDTNKRLKDAILFNILSYMSNRLIGIGNAVAAIDEPGFVSRLVSCFQKEQTDEQLIAVVNRTFGTDIQTEHFTQLVGNVRSQYVDTTQYVDFTTKNNLDLVQWAIAAEKAGWGYVWGTFGQVLSRDLLAAKVEQYPDNVGIYEEFIRSNYLGKRTADCVGFIKGYSWYDPQTDTVNYGSNGMPDIGADQMYQAAREKGSISTIPEIPGLAVWHTGHIGVYIGDGYVIEAMGTHYGVVKTRLSSGRWTHWLKIPYINYLEETEEMP